MLAPVGEEIYCKPILVDILSQIHNGNLEGNKTINKRWSDDMNCKLIDVSLSDDFVLSSVSYELPMSSFDGEISFNSMSYLKEEELEYEGQEDGLVIYSFGDFDDEDDPRVMLVVKIYKYQEEDFEVYLFSEGEDGNEFLEIKIVTTLIDENEINTFSSFSIDNGLVTGYFIERDGIPTTEQKIAGKKKRIPANTYDVVRNDCKKFYDDFGKERRYDCANEFRLITTPEKSGSRGGILIHKGANYEDSEGCLLPVGIGYKKVESDFYINGELKTLNIYSSNGTSKNILTAINDYVAEKEAEAKNSGKKLIIIIQLNR